MQSTSTRADPGPLLLQALDLNAIHVNPSRPWLFAVGGDDQYARVFDFRRMQSSAGGGAAGGEDGGSRGRGKLQRVDCEPVRGSSCMTLGALGIEWLYTYYTSILYDVVTRYDKALPLVCQRLP